MKHQEELTRSAGLVGSLTFLSRIAGYARDVVIAYFFGATASTDAFWVAFRIPNLLRRLFAEGSLTISFIPVFTQYLETKSKEEAKKVADAVFTILVFLLILISIGWNSTYRLILSSSSLQGLMKTLSIWRFP